MKHRPLGASGISASVIGLGTWVLGGGKIWGDETGEAESIRTIHAALYNGINLIDTAPAYGFGRSEQIIGKALQDRREQAVIATKCGLWWNDKRGSYFTELEGQKLYRSLRPDTIRIELESSLCRLRTDYIDLYQTHWPAIPPDCTPIADTMAILLTLKDQGKIRAIGVCNTSLDELKETLHFGQVTASQCRYSMLSRDAENEMLPFCAKHQVATLTYMSLEQGLLSGKIGMDREFKPTEFRSNAAWNPWFIPENRLRVLDMLAGWRHLTEKYHCTLAQLVIAWTAVQPGVTHVLTGGRNEQQILENATANTLVLEPADQLLMQRDVTALGEPIRPVAKPTVVLKAPVQKEIEALPPRSNLRSIGEPRFSRRCHPADSTVRPKLLRRSRMMPE